MPSFSIRSQERLNTCVEPLQALLNEVVKEFDCTILCGHRGQEEQNEAFRQGHSKVQWPNGKHNTIPSKAVDVTPYPIDWNDRERMTYFAGYVKGVAQSMGIKIRWGGDWDSDTEVADNGFDDLPHFEIRD